MARKKANFNLDEIRKFTEESVWQEGEQLHEQGFFKSVYKIGSRFEARGKEELPGLVRIETGEMVLSHSCACEEQPKICKHVVALALRIEEGKFTNRTAKIAVRKSVQEVKETISNRDKVLFLDELLHDNEEVGKLFLQRFGQQPASLQTLAGRMHINQWLLAQIQDIKVSKYAKKKGYMYSDGYYDFEKLENYLSDLLAEVVSEGRRFLYKGFFRSAIQCYSACMITNEEWKAAIAKWPDYARYETKMLETVVVPCMMSINDQLLAAKMSNQHVMSFFEVMHMCLDELHPYWNICLQGICKTKKAANLFLDYYGELMAKKRAFRRLHIEMAELRGNAAELEALQLASRFDNRERFYYMLDLYQSSNRQSDLEKMIWQALEHHPLLLSPKALSYLHGDTNSSLFLALFERLNKGHQNYYANRELSEELQDTPFEEFARNKYLMQAHISDIGKLQNKGMYGEMLVMARLHPDHKMLAELLKPNIEKAPKICLPLIRNRLEKLTKNKLDSSAANQLLALLRLLKSAKAASERAQEMLLHFYNHENTSRDVKLVFEKYQLID